MSVSCSSVWPHFHHSPQTVLKSTPSDFLLSLSFSSGIQSQWLKLATNSFLAIATASGVSSSQQCTVFWPHHRDGGYKCAVFKKDSRELSPPVWQHCQSVWTALLPVLVIRPDSTLAWHHVSNHWQGMERQCPGTPACISDPGYTRQQPGALPLQSQRKMKLCHLPKLKSLVCQCFVLLSSHPFRDMIAQCGGASRVWGRPAGLRKPTSLLQGRGWQGLNESPLCLLNEAWHETP